MVHRSEALKQWLSDIGEDPGREGLVDTPRRHTAAMSYLTSGYRGDPVALIKSALFTAPSQDLVTLRDIEFYSLCEHHILPFFGRVHVGYLPDRHIVGLSKIPRMVDLLARRLQVQERLAVEIAEALMKGTGALGVAVVVEAQHLCMMMRGVQKQVALTTTQHFLGALQEPERRNSFLASLGAVGWRATSTLM